MGKKKTGTDSNNSEANETYIVIDELNHYPLPDLLLQVRPYRNTETKEIRYMNSYELYTRSMSLYAHPDHQSPGFVQALWEPIEDSITLRILYGQKKAR